MKGLIFLGILFCLVFSCANSKNISHSEQVRQNYGNLEFVEVRRLNTTMKLKEASLIHSTKEIKALYDKLKDSRFSRSFPIPSLKGDEESFLVLKPKLKYIKYGDIEIEKLYTEGSTLIVNYKEIENWEYAEKKQSDPILILKILNRSNQINTIKLNLMKKNL